MSKEGLFITAEIRIRDEADYSQGVSAIKAFCAGMNSEPGCLTATAMISKDDPATFIFWEQYRSKEAFEAHFNAPHTKTFIESGLTELVRAYETTAL